MCQLLAPVLRQMVDIGQTDLHLPARAAAVAVGLSVIASMPRPWPPQIARLVAALEGAYAALPEKVRRRLPLPPSRRE